MLAGQQDQDYVAMALSSTDHPDEAPPDKSPLWRVVGNFINTVVGAGIVGLPFTLHRAGFYSGIAMMVLACALTHVSLGYLIHTGIRLRMSTFEDICEALFGRTGYYLVVLSLLIFDTGATLSFMIILTDSAARVVAQLFPGAGGHDGAVHDYCLLAFCPLLLFLSLKRDMAALEQFSWSAVALVGALAAFVLWRFVDLAETGEVDAGEPLTVFNPGIAAAFGTAAFSFVNNDVAFPLYNTLHNPTRARWARLSAISMSTALVVCALFATFGYLTFRDKVTDNLLNDYPPRGPAIAAMRLAYALTLSLTFPTTFFVVRHVLNELLYRGTPGYKSVKDNGAGRHVGLSLAIFALLVLLTISRVTLGFVMSFSGGLAAVVLAFVLPPALWIKSHPCYSPAFWRNRGAVWASMCELGPPCLMLAFGLVMAVGASVQSVACEFFADGERLANLC